MQKSQKAHGEEGLCNYRDMYRTHKNFNME